MPVRGKWLSNDPQLHCADLLLQRDSLVHPDHREDKLSSSCNHLQRSRFMATTRFTRFEFKCGEFPKSWLVWRSLPPPLWTLLYFLRDRLLRGDVRSCCVANRCVVHRFLIFFGCSSLTFQASASTSQQRRVWPKPYTISSQNPYRRRTNEFNLRN